MSSQNLVFTYVVTVSSLNDTFTQAIQSVSSPNVFFTQAALAVEEHESAEDRAEGIFRRMDTNSDGKVTR